MQDYIWYLSYGSNLSKQRFLCYIEGGTPVGSSKEEKGCDDKSLPLKDEPYIFSYPLYFARNSIRWDGGVAYIDTKKDPKARTFGRIYLITKSQFMDVVAQETGCSSINIDFDLIIKNKSKVVAGGLYGNIIHIGEEAGYPIFTFTSPDEMEEKLFNKPSEPYLNMIASGLVETFGLNEEEIEKYIKETKGFENN